MKNQKPGDRGQRTEVNLFHSEGALRAEVMTTREQISKGPIRLFDDQWHEGQITTANLWNKIEDGRPDDEIEVLVFVEEDDDMYLAIHQENGWTHGGYIPLPGVTHWMEVIPPEATQ